MKLKYNLKRKVSLCLVAAMLFSAVDITAPGTRAVAAGTVSANELTVGDGGEEYIDVSALMGEQETTAAAEQSTKVQQDGAPEETTTASEPETDASVTEPVTEEPTTKATTNTVKAWGKNEKGQFVNGNKKVIVGATMKGVDVSYHNGTINWSKVAKSDVDYAIIRCGYGNNLTSQDDKKWAENVAGCEKYNIPYGVYIYSYATTTAQAKSEAKHVLRLIQGHTLNFPIYYDMEDAVQAKLTTKQRTKIAKKFLNTISAQGYECGIYANLNWWTNYLSDDIASNLSWYKWVAQYNNTACTYDGIYQMWQCTSSGSVSGISGKVDLNFWFGEVRTTAYNIKNSNRVDAAETVTPPGRVKGFSVSKGKKKATLSWNAVTGIKGYRIEYSTTKSFAATSTKFTKKTTVKVKKLTRGKRYYFRIKAYKKNSFKQKVYSKKWSKVKSAKIL